MGFRAFIIGAMVAAILIAGGLYLKNRKPWAPEIPQNGKTENPEPNGGTVTPSPGEEVISWERAVELIKNCEVRMAAQTHSLKIYLTLKNGKTVIATEPVIDDMFSAIESARGVCGDIPVATE